MSPSLLQDLGRVISTRNPLLAERLKPGLTESEIREALARANVTGAIEPIIELYSWRNGTLLDEQTSMGETSFFPEDTYQFLNLGAALSQFDSMKEAGAQLKQMLKGTSAHVMFSGLTGRLFPLFSDGATGILAIDLAPSKQNRVVVIEFESGEPVRQAYGSFKEFITDAIRAIRDERRLSCLK